MRRHVLANPWIGLSPRVRGNLWRRSLRSRHPRSIPACAGEPAGLRSRMLRKWVYPRVCGGTTLRAHHDVQMLGLSPRVRGNHPKHNRRYTRFRSIPACAGEPRTLPKAAGGHRVYPRVCGGTICDTQAKSSRHGLSPRVRGNLVPCPKLPAGIGSIPACAGEPFATPKRNPVATVYPRVCGGTERLAEYLPADDGLSPRVRGNPMKAADQYGTGGSIPACAGEPAMASAAVNPMRVYPRVCGGTSGGVSDGTTVWGLSPRVRGNR